MIESLGKWSGFVVVAAVISCGSDSGGGTGGASGDGASGSTSTTGSPASTGPGGPTTSTGSAMSKTPPGGACTTADSCQTFGCYCKQTGFSGCGAVCAEGVCGDGAANCAGVCEGLMDVLDHAEAQDC